MSERVFALIAGSGFENGWLPEMKEAELPREMPFGALASPVLEGRIGDHRVLFLQRHGENHRYPPHAIPYARESLGPA
ncbi:MAG: hypothetical protein V8S69_06950 [Dakarella massiliensis]